LISGKELKEVFVWKDTNLNAWIDAGEAVPASSVLEEISTKFDTVGGGDVYNPKGAKLRNGIRVPVWDWWSQTFPNVVGGKGAVIPGRVYPTYLSPERLKAAAKPVVYMWESTDTEGPTKGSYGMLRFFRDGERLMVLSLGPDFKGTSPVSQVNVNGNQLEWVFFNGEGDLRTQATIEGNTIVGVSTYSGGEEARWKAIAGPPQGGIPSQIISVFSVFDKDLVAAIESGPAMITFPFGYRGIPGGPEMKLADLIGKGER